MSDAEVYDYYILFPNHHEGLRLYRDLKTARVRCTIAPTPRFASSFCGMSLLISEEYVVEAERIIAQGNVNITGIIRNPRKVDNR